METFCPDPQKQKRRHTGHIGSARQPAPPSEQTEKAHPQCAANCFLDCKIDPMRGENAHSKEDGGQKQRFAERF